LRDSRDDLEKVCESAELGGVSFALAGLGKGACAGARFA
jgi:hypothetical protein